MNRQKIAKNSPSKANKLASQNLFGPFLVAILSELDTWGLSSIHLLQHPHATSEKFRQLPRTPCELFISSPMGLQCSGYCSSVSVLEEPNK